MNAQDLILGSRVAHVRELKTEISKLKAENDELKAELESLRAHFDLALTAAKDLENLAEGAKMHVFDGWNLVLGAGRTVRSRDELLTEARRHLDEHPDDLVWIVFDGPRENVRNSGRLRVSYTGGTGQHRADRFICDFWRMARFRGLEGRIEVHTRDKDFLRQLVH